MSTTNDPEGEYKTKAEENAMDRIRSVAKEAASKVDEMMVDKAKREQLLGDLYEDFVDLHHPQFRAGFFFDDFQTLAQVMNFGRYTLIGAGGLGIALVLLVEFPHQLRHVGHTAPAKP